MKTPLLAAAFALSILTGGAFAQQPAPAEPAPPPPPAAEAPPAPPPPAEAAPPPAAMPAAPTTTANTPAGEQPAEYPVCTKRGQDRCKSTGRRGY